MAQELSHEAGDVRIRDIAGPRLYLNYYLSIMRIETGRGTMPLITLIAVWSISAMISLPGLAVSPILGSLTKIFPHATDIEIQMLSSIPSLLIIPFIILSGYLSTGYDKVKILVIGLLIYILSGAACIFAKSITLLIILSTVLGIGAGMIIPLSTGFIAQLFVGKYRTAQLGISSSIANLSLVVATFLTGWLAQINWHLPFVVYLFPILTLVMSRFLDSSRVKMIEEHEPGRPAPNAKKMGLGTKTANRTGMVAVPAKSSTPGAGASSMKSSGNGSVASVTDKSGTASGQGNSSTLSPASEAKPVKQVPAAQDEPTVAIPAGKSYNITALAGVMLLYFLSGYAALTVIFNLPFVILHHHLDSTVTGTLTAIFYLAIMTPGLFMNKIRAVLGRFSVMVSMLLISIGLIGIFFSPRIILIGVSVVLIGLGYGFIQPFVYDKATQTAIPAKSIIALAYVMAVNYLTIVIAPFIISGFDKAVGAGSNVLYSFLTSSVIALVVAIWAALRNRHFVFSI